MSAAVAAAKATAMAATQAAMAVAAVILASGPVMAAGEGRSRAQADN